MQATDLHHELARRVLVPLYQSRWGVYAPSIHRDLTESQYRSTDEIQDLQWSRLKGLLRFAFSSNPFYCSRFGDSGIHPNDIKSWDDFRRLPLLTKDDIRTNNADLISTGYDQSNLFHKRTGGSTGVPVHVYWDLPARRHKNAALKRHDAWAGYELGMQRAALWGNTDKRLPWRARLYHSLCERTTYLDTLRMDAAYMDAFVAEIRRLRSRVLIGHAHSIYFFTRHLIEQDVHDLPIQSIISTAETLIPQERQEIESHFGPILFDRYGCEEVSLIASECEAHDGLHVSAEGLFVETIETGPSAPGRVVVTDLTNRGMPLIRYDVGDLATFAKGACSCGRGLPRLERIFGRTSDVLYSPEGKQISGISILDTFLIHISGIKQAQIIQVALDRLIMRVVRDSSYGPHTENEIQQAIREIFGPRMTSEIQAVDTIPSTQRGKFQFTICEIDPPSGSTKGPNESEDPHS